MVEHPGAEDLDPGEHMVVELAAAAGHGGVEETPDAPVRAQRHYPVAFHLRVLADDQGRRCIVA